MSPLKIKMLLSLYSQYDPFNGMPAEQRIAPAMFEAYRWFDQEGLLADGVTHYEMLNLPRIRPGSVVQNRLSEKGLELVQRLIAVEP